MAGIYTHLKILLWNVENLFLLFDQPIDGTSLKLDEVQWQKMSTSIFPNKSLAKTKCIAETILAENCDIVMLCEVGGPESLRNFNRLFLEDRYSPVLIEGNSERNIDIGFLVRRDIGFYFDLVSNKNRAVPYIHPSERNLEKPTFSRFSRDAAELHLFMNDRESPFLVLLLTHLKSRLDREKIDPFGFERRQAEFQALIEIYDKLHQRYTEPIPIAVCGDFNGNASRVHTDREFQTLYQHTNLIDVCEIAQLDLKDRATYYQVHRSTLVGTEAKQIDYCFLSPELRPYLMKESVRVLRYKDPLGFPLDPPTTMESKVQLPSDHYPLVFELQNLPVEKSRVRSST